MRGSFRAGPIQRNSRCAESAPDAHFRNLLAWAPGYAVLMRWQRLFSEHPASVGETYLQHMGQAARFGTRLVFAGLACLVHSLLPFLFTRTARNAISDLYVRVVLNRGGPPADLQGRRYQSP